MTVTQDIGILADAINQLAIKVEILAWDLHTNQSSYSELIKGTKEIRDNISKLIPK